MKKILGVLLFFAFVSADAALIDAGSQHWYDDVLDITWWGKGDLAAIDHAGATTWAANLTRGGFTDWRLPSMDLDGAGGPGDIVNCSTASESDCRDNELGYLFHQYGVTNANPAPFIGINALNYWSSTTGSKGRFRVLNFGTGAIGLTSDQSLRLAVHDGNIFGVTAVPIPAAVWLFGSALGLLGWMRRKTK